MPSQQNRTTALVWPSRAMLALRSRIASLFASRLDQCASRKVYLPAFANSEGETMRSLLTIMLLAVAVLPALSHAQTVNICDRTPQVRDEIMRAIGANDCATVTVRQLAAVDVLCFGQYDNTADIPCHLSYDRDPLVALKPGDFAGLTGLQYLYLWDNQLASLPADVFNGLAGLVILGLGDNQLANLPQGVFNGLTSLQGLGLDRNRLASLPAGAFAGLTSLLSLALERNQLASLPAGVFNGLTRFLYLNMFNNRLTALPAGVFDSLTSLLDLELGANQLVSLPAGVFDKLIELEHLRLPHNQLTALPAGVFDSLTSLDSLILGANQLTALPAGVFDNLANLWHLGLGQNQLASLPAGVFDSLIRLRYLDLGRNQLTSLPAGVFDSMTLLRRLYLNNNRLTKLSVGVFDNLASLLSLTLHNNHFVGLTENDPLFARLPDETVLQLDGQTETPGTPTTTATRLAAAVPLLVSASDSMRQGFVRIINESNQSGSVRILAFDDAGTAANPVEIRLNANHEFHFNAGDLENGNANKGINAGVGSPSRGDWRLDVETALNVRVLSFIRTNDGFLTAMHDVLQRDAQGRLAALTFNPARNTSRVSKLRLVNIGANAESVRIDGVDGQGNNAGPVSLTLAAGEARTLSAQDLENGAQGLTGMLDAGNGKWRLFITAEQSVVGMSLLDSASGHLSNISTMGNAIEGR